MKKEYLDVIAADSIYTEGVAALTMRYCSNIFEKYMVQGGVLELGPAEGLMTELIYKDEYHFAKRFNDSMYSIVEGSHIFAEKIRSRFPKIDIHEMMFEDFKPTQLYENILLGHVLEHVEDPTFILCKCKEWLANNGRILAAVPNANSIHRQAAVKMGVLDTIYCFSEKDRRHGHQRVFDMTTFKQCFIDAELNIVKQGGYWLKPLSDRQVNESWTSNMIDAFLALGEEYPEIAGEIYIIAEKPKGCSE